MAHNGVMAFCAALALAITLFAQSALAQSLAPPPWVKQGGIVNLASRFPSSLPGGALAPRALIEIEGIRFHPADLSVEIEAQGKVYQATIIRATSDHIVVRLPDFAYKGAARLFVQSDGKRSVGSDIRLAPAAYGILQSETPVVTAAGRVTLSGTGLGHTQDSAIEVVVAGRRATHVKRAEQGEFEQVAFDLPAGTPEGCAVPVFVVAGGLTSNTALMKLGACATGGRTGTVVLMRSDAVLELAPGKAVPFRVDSLAATFERRRDPKDPDPLDLIPPAGACASWAGAFDSNTFVLPSLIGGADTTVDLGPDLEQRTSSVDDLDAGPELTLAGPAGIRHIRRAPRRPRAYTVMLGGNPPLTRIPPSPPYLAPGPYRIEIPGGTDVGPASVDLTIPEAVVWRNRESTRVLDRKSGADLEGSVPPGYRALVFAWNIDRRTGTAGVAVCAASPGATRFRIPGLALANFPATRVGASDLSLGFLGVAAIPNEPGTIHARGLGRSRVVAASLSGRSVVVK